MTCSKCGGFGYVKVKLPPSHQLFGKAILCPNCGRTFLNQQLAKRWPITTQERAFGLTPYGTRNTDAVVFAFKTTQAFLTASGARFLTLYGKPGCGKTHLLLILRRLAHESGFSTIYASGKKVQERIQQFSNDVLRIQHWHDMTNVDLLIIDDLDGFTGEKIKPKILELLKARIAKGLPTASALNDYQYLPQKIISRLTSYAPWAPNGPRGQSGWVDMSHIPDGRPHFGIAPRPIGELDGL